MDERSHRLVVFINGFKKGAHHQHQPIHAALGELPAAFVPLRRSKPFESAQFTPNAAKKVRPVPPTRPFTIESKTKHFYKQTVAHLVSQTEAVLGGDAG